MGVVDATTPSSSWKRGRASEEGGGGRGMPLPPPISIDGCLLVVVGVEGAMGMDEAVGEGAEGAGGGLGTAAAAAEGRKLAKDWPGPSSSPSSPPSITAPPERLTLSSTALSA